MKKVWNSHGYFELWEEPQFERCVYKESKTTTSNNIKRKNDNYYPPPYKWTCKLCGRQFVGDEKIIKKISAHRLSHLREADPMYDGKNILKQWTKLLESKKGKTKNRKKYRKQSSSKNIIKKLRQIDSAGRKKICQHFYNSRQRSLPLKAFENDYKKFIYNINELKNNDWRINQIVTFLSNKKNFYSYIANKKNKVNNRNAVYPDDTNKISDFTIFNEKSDIKPYNNGDYQFRDNGKFGSTPVEDDYDN